MSPDQRCAIYNADDQLVEVRVITLAVWASGLKGAVKGVIVNPNLVPTVREFLKADKDCTIKDMSDHINSSYDDVKVQLRELGLM